MDGYRLVTRRRFHLSVNTILILINFVLFIILSVLVSINPNFLSYFSLNPSNVLQGKYLWTFLTSMFSHVYFWHIAFNMISLFFVGVLAERIIGPKRYLLFYLAAGLFAGLVFVLLAGFLGTNPLGAKLFGSPDTAGIGASGAIFGIVGLLAVLTPKNRIYLVAGPLIAIIAESVLSNFASAPIMSAVDLVVTVYVFFSLFAMFSFNSFMRKIIVPINLPFWMLPIIAIVPLVVIGLFVPLPIGNSAHLGGLLIGLAYGFYLKHKFPRKTEMISRAFSR
ncbi:MAG: rhomboid family intramembrane serine protease [Candidatus Pacearchaeota archaeon]|nr:rhomboid family intramembrane serine protease [Candidatus Pacearchaeota archaeon]MDE1848487.1 rhomboid family intramembrane serine protease [Nanoarchaeota archaeon]